MTFDYLVPKYFNIILATAKIKKNKKLITDNFIALIAVNNSLDIQLLPSIPSC
jgi:hypothetical protein